MSIFKIFDNAKVETSWNDKAENVVEETHNSIFARKNKESTRGDLVEVRGESGRIKNVRGGWYTKDSDVKNAALDAGYWCEDDPDFGTEIHFTWSRDKNNKPNSRSYRK